MLDSTRPLVSFGDLQSPNETAIESDHKTSTKIET